MKKVLITISFITHLKFFAQRLVEYKKTKQARRCFLNRMHSNLCSNDKKDKSWFILMMIYLMELLKECIREIIVVQENFQMCL